MAIAKKSEQTEAIPAAHVKFTGMSGSALTDPAGLGDTQTFTVTARCIGTGNELRKDGEVRQVRRMEVVEVEFGEIVKAANDPALFAVGNRDEDDEL